MEILNSWKEIASYLGRGVRTVQRWERDLGLPVHRPKGRDRSAVLAFPEELQKWLQDTPVRSREFIVPSPFGAEPNADGQPVMVTTGPMVILERRARTQMRDNHTRSRQLICSVYEAAQRQQVLAATLSSSLEKMARSRQARTTAAA